MITGEESHNSCKAPPVKFLSSTSQRTSSERRVKVYLSLYLTRCLFVEFPFLDGRGVWMDGVMILKLDLYKYKNSFTVICRVLHTPVVGSTPKSRTFRTARVPAPRSRRSAPRSNLSPLESGSPASLTRASITLTGGPRPSRHSQLLPRLCTS